MENEYDYSVEDWVEICRKYYDDNPLLQFKGNYNPYINHEKSLETKINMTNGKNTSGYFRVSILKTKQHKKKPYRYRYYDEDGKRKSIHKESLESLKEEVLKRGLEWIIVDEEKAKRTDELSAKQNTPSNPPIIKLFD